MYTWSGSVSYPLQGCKFNSNLLQLGAESLDLQKTTLDAKKTTKRRHIWEISRNCDPISHTATPDPSSQH